MRWYNRIMPEPPAPQHDHHHTERYIRYALIAAVGTLVILVVVLTFQYVALRREQVLNGRLLHYSRLFTPSATLSPSDAGIIRPWMTFDYLNHLFALPSSYLQSHLAITDTRYPHLTITAYANAVHEDQTATLNDIEDAIRAYLPATSTSTTASGTRRT